MLEQWVTCNRKVCYLFTTLGFDLIENIIPVGHGEKQMWSLTYYTLKMRESDP